MKKYQNFLSKDEVNEILEWLESKPYTKEVMIDPLISADAVKYRNKSLDFHLESSLVRKIVFPKLKKIIPNADTADPTNSAFLESHYPFGLHVDTLKTFDKNGFYSIKNTTTNTAVLIALNESPDFKTVFFDFYTDDLDKDYDSLPSSSQPVSTLEYPGVDLSHFSDRSKEFLQYHKIKCIDCCRWEQGLAMVWPRTQLHSSSNFSGKGIKKALVLFF